MKKESKISIKAVDKGEGLKINTQIEGGFLDTELLSAISPYISKVLSERPYLEPLFMLMILSGDFRKELEGQDLVAIAKAIENEMKNKKGE